MFLDNPFLLVSPWASALFSAQSRIPPDKKTARYGFATIVSALAASAAVMSRPFDASKRVSFLWFDGMYLSGVILFCLAITAVSAVLYQFMFHLHNDAGSGGMRSFVGKVGMLLSLALGHFGFWLTLILPQNL